jgi:hypothetical protein
MGEVSGQIHVPAALVPGSHRCPLGRRLCDPNAVIEEKARRIISMLRPVSHSSPLVDSQDLRNLSYNYRCSDGYDYYFYDIYSY